MRGEHQIHTAYRLPGALQCGPPPQCPI